MVLEIKSKLETQYTIETKARASTQINPIPIPGRQDAILKQVFPQYLYNPPYGFPKRLNGQFLRKIAENLNVSSVIKTIKDEIILTEWDITTEEDYELSEAEQAEVKEIKELFCNPNPEDTYESFMKKFLEDLLVLESGCINNVFDRKQKLKQLRAVDGNSILKNPDINGSFTFREEIITDWVNFMYSVNRDGNTWKQAQSRYGTAYTNRAAYFQYNGALAHAFPVPYGKDEIVYIQLNPASHNVYTNGSPVSDAIDVILALVYSVKYHLDFFLNGNSPEGIIQLAGGTSDDIESVKQQLQTSTYTYDELTGYERKMGYVLPIVNSDNASFVPLTFNSRDMEILAQQNLLNKLLWQRFGVTADEMGHTDDSNRATSKTQTDNAKRKAVMPILKVIEDNFNKFIIEKFFEVGKQRKVKFKFTHDTSDEELTKLEIYQRRVNLGLETWQTLAEKENIDLGKLKQFRDDNNEEEMQKMETQNGFKQNNINDKSESKPKQEQKSNSKSNKVPENLELEKIIEDISEEITEQTKKI